MRGYMLTFGSRFCSNKFVSDMVSTAARGNNNVFEAGEKLYKMFFRRATIFFAAGVRHRLAAAGLFDGVLNFHFKTLKQLKRSNPYFRIKRIDIAGNH